ncbi:hypothetical protein IscW_ISCW022852 [Ixodes scapularis]|uniref:Uncharacterized protein n=1 Tax=Ixodes scapularis TaxID=6945 RepID=B7QC57_IXOSC|nr:hypothetical protein IscW_ISCW022852 [Ixodes scapularis]|eukprot:XP_002413120.1 hypothetical protein IscW_ISCW022852 [Ixodes scapularis]
MESVGLTTAEALRRLHKCLKEELDIFRGKEQLVVLDEKETFVPETRVAAGASFAGARLRRPVESRRFIMLEAPFLKYFRLCLENSLMRPVSTFSKERHVINCRYLERIVIPVVLCDPEDPFEEENEARSTQPQAVSPSWSELRPLVVALLRGKAPDLWRTSSLLHVLGSVTTLCCVDKKGILSWPNPTPEKVFFLKPPRARSAIHGSSFDSPDATRLPPRPDVVPQDGPENPDVTSGAGDSGLEENNGKQQKS